jgi:anthranilate/para-aminobenzoate synthase component II
MSRPGPHACHRFHSLIIEPGTLPDDFGVQFQPESLLTPGGQKLLANFLRFG